MTNADGLELVEREMTQGQKLAAKAIENRIAALEKRIERDRKEIAECKVLLAQVGMKPGQA